MPLQFPQLPTPLNHIQWPADIVTAHRHLASIFQRGETLLTLDNPDPLRSQLVVTEIFGKCLSLLEALESEYPEATWVLNAAETLFNLGGQLRQAANASEGV